MTTQRLASAPDFSGKLVWVFVLKPQPPERSGILLEFPEFVDRAGAVFLTGRILMSEDGRSSRYRQAAIAWGSVSRYCVFPSVQDYRARVQAMQRKRRST